MFVFDFQIRNTEQVQVSYCHLQGKSATYRTTSIPPNEVWGILETSKQNKVSSIPHYFIETR